MSQNSNTNNAPLPIKQETSTFVIAKNPQIIQQNITKANVQIPPSIISTAPLAMQQYIAPNPTFANNMNTLHVLQQSLQSRQITQIKTQSTTNHTTGNTSTIQQTTHKMLYYPQQVFYKPYAPPLNQLPPIPPQHSRDTALNQHWSATLAYAATLSSIINETSSIYREKCELTLKPKWSQLLYKLEKCSDNKETELEQKQLVYDEAINHIFSQSEIYLKEVSSKMSETKIIESIGIMKGLTDGICNLVTNASLHCPGCNPVKMRHLFDNKLLILWCSLLLRATTDVREAMQRYLGNSAFSQYFSNQTALNGEFYKHLSADEHLLLQLRTDKEQQDFEANTKKYVEEANISLAAMKQMTVLPDNDRIYNSRKRKLPANLSRIPGPKPPKKRKKKSRYQLFRVDGTPRKRQQNPCDRRICKKMWQSDGVTRGCGENSHPRGVCPCWKALNFTKADEKNGNIVQWLKNAYGKDFEM